jgi:hypothetical protein
MNTIGQIRYWKKGKTIHHTTEQSVCFFDLEELTIVTGS